MLCQSVSSFHSPDCWSFQRRFVAIEKVDLEIPLGVNLVSASFPRCPSRITLLTLRDAMVPRNVPQCGELLAWKRSRRGRRPNGARSGPGAGILHGKIGGYF